MKASKKLTVITICKNSEGIEDTCKSIVRQTWQDFEWIVVDGASSEETLAVLDKYKSRIDVFISEEDAGVYAAMNKGIRLARGEWISFMNGGDAFTDVFVLSRVFDGKDYPNADVLYGKNHFIDPKSQKLLSTADYPKKLSMEFFSYASLCHQSTFLRRSLFSEFDEYNERMKMCADYEKFILWFHAGKRFLKLPMVVANFRRGGISSTNPQLQTCERALAREVLPIEQRRILSTPREPMETAYKCKLFDLIELFKIKRTRSGKIKNFYVLGVPVFRMESNLN